MVADIIGYSSILLYLPAVNMWQSVTDMLQFLLMEFLGILRPAIPIPIPEMMSNIATDISWVWGTVDILPTLRTVITRKKVRLKIMTIHLSLYGNGTYIVTVKSGHVNYSTDLLGWNKMKITVLVYVF